MAKVERCAGWDLVWEDVSAVDIHPSKPGAHVLKDPERPRRVCNGGGGRRFVRSVDVRRDSSRSGSNADLSEFMFSTTFGP